MPSKNHNIKPNNKFVRVTDVPYWGWMASGVRIKSDAANIFLAFEKSEENKWNFCN
jgi:hypothetical protein